MRILREEAAAVVVDVQERLYPHIHEHELLSKNLQTLVAGLRQLEVPLLVTQQYTRGLGETIAPVAAALGNYQAIEKMAFSCCGQPEFMTALAETGAKRVILMGIEAHVCVLQTGLDLLEAGYTPVLIEDCVSSRSEANRCTGIERLRAEGAIISSCESILFELCRVAGGDTFKAISRLVK